MKLSLQASEPIRIQAASDRRQPLEFAASMATFEASDGESSPRFKIHAYTGGKLHLPGYPVPVVIDLATARFGDGGVNCLMDHNSDQRVGHTVDRMIDPEKGIFATAIASAATQYRDEVVDSAKDGFEWQISVGGSTPPENIDQIPAGKVIKANGRTLQGPLLFAKNVVVREITFCGTGADVGGANARLIAASQGNQTMFEQWLKARGLDISTLNEEQTAALLTDFKAEQEREAAKNKKPEASVETPETAPEAKGEKESSAPKTPQDVVAEQRKLMAEEVAREDAIREAAVEFENPKHKPEGADREVPVAQTAIAAGWSVEKTRTQMELCNFRASLGRAPAAHTQRPHSQETVLNAAVGSLLLRNDVKIDQDCWRKRSLANFNASFTADVNDPKRDEWMNLAHDYSTLPLVELMASIAKQNGANIQGYAGKDSNIQASFSSAAVQDTFTTSVNAILLAAFNEDGTDNTDLWTQSRDIRDYQTQERKRLQLGGTDLEILPPEKTATHATLTSTGEELSMARYAKQWQFDEQDAINDRFDMLAEMPLFFGRAARRLASELCWKILMSNPNLKDGTALFHTSRGNIATSTALSLANIKAQLPIFETMEEDDVLADLDANLMMYPFSDRYEVAEHFGAMVDRGGNTTVGTTTNPISDEVERRVGEKRLDKGFKDPADRLTEIAANTGLWFIGDYRYPIVEKVYRIGTGRQPYLRSSMLSQGKWGMNFDVNHDIGAGAIRATSMRRCEA